MNVAPKLYQRGTRGTWWVDLGEVSGVRHRRSTGSSDQARAMVIAQGMAAELHRHSAAQRIASLVKPPSCDEWSQQIQSATARKLFDKLWTNARGRARRDGLLWSLSRSNMDTLIEASSGRCAVTGLGFVLDDTPRNPLKPSLDRIDNSTGYSTGNCRLTLMAVNYAMNVWGEDLFATVALSYSARRLELEAQNRHSKFRNAGEVAKSLI